MSVMKPSRVSMDGMYQYRGKECQQTWREHIGNLEKRCADVRGSGQYSVQLSRKFNNEDVGTAVAEVKFYLSRVGYKRSDSALMFCINCLYFCFLVTVILKRCKAIHCFVAVHL